MTNFLSLSLTIRVLWALLGVIFGSYALIKVRKKTWQKNLRTKFLWQVQLALTPLSGLFVLWVGLVLVWGNFPVLVPWQLLLPLIIGSLLALPNAFWLLVEALDL